MIDGRSRTEWRTACIPVYHSLCSEGKIRFHSSCRTDTGIHLAISVTTEQSWSELGRLQNMGFEAGARLQDCSQRRQLAETASHRHLVKSVSERHRQRNWPVASATPSVCEDHFDATLSICCITTGSFSGPPTVSRIKHVSLIQHQH